MWGLLFAEIVQSSVTAPGRVPLQIQLGDSLSLQAQQQRRMRRAVAGVSLPEDVMPDDATATRLPQDVIFEVISRLTVKQLCRLRCVSKGWRALISDPIFITAQRSRAAAGPLLLLIGVFQGRPQRVTRTSALPGAPPRYRSTLELRVMDVRGNVLRVVEDVEDRKLSRARLDLVYLNHELYGARAIDPETARAVSIGAYVDEPAVSDAVDPDTGRVFKRLGGDPDISYSGFGRANPSGVYKAVRIDRTVGSVRAEVATLDGGGELTWRKGPAAPFLRCCSPWCTPTTAGVLYFVPCSGHSSPILGRNRIAAFDLETEEWKPMIEFPKEGVLGSLVELKGTLAMVHRVYGEGWRSQGNQTNVWFLVDPDKSTWVKQHVIQMHESWRYIGPLEVSDGRMLLLNWVEKHELNSHCLRCVLQLRDPNTGARTELTEMPTGYHSYQNRMSLYRGSL